MRLKARLEKLEHKHDSEPWEIQVWLHSLDGKSVTGLDGRRYTPEEAERLQVGSTLVIDLRKKPCG